MTTYNPAALPELVALLEEIDRIAQDSRYSEDVDREIKNQEERRCAALALARQHPSTACPVCSYPFAQPYCPRCDAAALAGQLCTHCYTCGRLYPASGACPSDHSELAQARARIAELERRLALANQAVQEQTERATNAEQELHEALKELIAANNRELAHIHGLLDA